MAEQVKINEISYPKQVKINEISYPKIQIRVFEELQLSRAFCSEVFHLDIHVQCVIIVAGDAGS